MCFKHFNVGSLILDLITKFLTLKLYKYLKTLLGFSKTLLICALNNHLLSLTQLK